MLRRSTMPRSWRYVTHEDEDNLLLVDSDMTEDAAVFDAQSSSPREPAKEPAPSEDLFASLLAQCELFQEVCLQCEHNPSQDECLQELRLGLLRAQADLQSALLQIEDDATLMEFLTVNEQVNTAIDVYQAVVESYSPDGSPSSSSVPPAPARTHSHFELEELLCGTPARAAASLRRSYSADAFEELSGDVFTQPGSSRTSTPRTPISVK